VTQQRFTTKDSKLIYGLNSSKLSRTIRVLLKTIINFFFVIETIANFLTFDPSPASRSSSHPAVLHNLHQCGCIPWHQLPICL